MSQLWRKCRLRIFSVGAATDANDDTLRTRLEDYLRQMRIPAELHIVKVADDVLDDAFRDRTLDMEARRKLLEQLQQDQNSVTGVLRAPPPALRGRTRRALSGLFDGLSSPSSPRAGGDESPAVDAQDGSAALTAAGDAQRPATTVCAAHSFCVSHIYIHIPLHIPKVYHAICECLCAVDH